MAARFNVRVFARLILVCSVCCLVPRAQGIEPNPFIDGQAEFYGVEKVEVLSSDDVERWFALSDDGLEIFVHRTAPGSIKSVWRASRSSRSEEFGEPSLVTELSPPVTGPTHAVRPEFLSSDGKMLVVLSFERDGAFNRYGDPGIRYREVVGVPFRPTQYDTLVNIQDARNYERLNGLSSDGLELFFSKGRSGYATHRIYRSTRHSDESPFGTPEFMPQFGGPDVEATVPRLTPDDLVLLYREGDQASTTLCAAVRPSRGAPFGSPVHYEMDIPVGHFDFTADLEEFYVANGDIYRVWVRSKLTRVSDWGDYR